VENLDDALDGIEEKMASSNPSETRFTLGKIRQEAVVFRKYMAPQREAVSMIFLELPDWLEEPSRLRLRETSNRLMQFVESIEEARERAVVLDDGIVYRMSESMNRHMYLLSIIAGIFLPLGFITGLLGINVGGMPGVENSMAFWITCIGIGAILIIELLIFRLLKWI
jgi:zinc transporter